jgi:hypothetical protein
MLLYQYRRISDYTIKGLQDQTIHFTCPTKFNAPFDCRINFFIDGPDENWKNYGKRLGMSHEELKRYRDNSTRRKENAGSYDENIKYHILKDYLITCFSEIPDDILMWSHYANCHSGICLIFEASVNPTYPDLPYIEFDNNDLHYVNQFLQPNQGGIIKVKYSDTMPPESYDHLNYDKRQITPFLLTKSKHWEYEKERRMIMTTTELKNDNPRYLPNQLKGVIFGLNSSLDTIKKVRDSVADKNVQFSLCKAIDNQYKIGFSKIK